MKEILVGPGMAGQKLDRLLENYMKNAGRNFIYRMLRKKNITLNGRKATGHEALKEGDVVRIWFSDETMEKMTGIPANAGAGSAAGSRSGASAGSKAGTAGSRTGAAARGDVTDIYAAYPRTKLDILYEDEHVLIVSKSAGMLTQKARPGDIS